MHGCLSAALINPADSEGGSGSLVQLLWRGESRSCHMNLTEPLQIPVSEQTVRLPETEAFREQSSPQHILPSRVKPRVVEPRAPNLPYSTQRITAYIPAH